MRQWSERTGLSATRLVKWLGICRSKFYDWKRRYGKVNEHNSWIPRDHWLEQWEKQAIISFGLSHRDEGYRRLAFKMLDEDVVAVSPATVHRVLREAGLMRRRWRKESRKGKGFEQPLQPHEHWHVDISYINLCGTFYYLCGVLDGCSRYLLHWEIRESMKEFEVEIVIQRAREKFPGVRPRIISDNGPQFVAKDFKEFIRVSGMTHVRTSPYYPQSNGKYERWNGTVKQECIRPQAPTSLEEARRVVARFVEEYNTERFHSAIGYITPKDMLEGRSAEVHAERDRKLAEAREQRRENRRRLRTAS